MRHIIIILALSALACGSALPTAVPPPRPTAYVEPTAAYVPIVKEERGQLVHTLGQLNVRSCPSTRCAVLRVLEAGAAVYVDKVVINNDWNCSRWYPLVDEAGFICADWTSK